MTAPVAGTTLGSGEATPGLMRRDSLMTAVYVVNQHVYVVGKGVCIDRRRIICNSPDTAASPTPPSLAGDHREWAKR